MSDTFPYWLYRVGVEAGRAYAAGDRDRLVELRGLVDEVFVEYAAAELRRDLDTYEKGS